LPFKSRFDTPCGLDTIAAPSPGSSPSYLTERDLNYPITF